MERQTVLYSYSFIYFVCFLFMISVSENEMSQTNTLNMPGRINPAGKTKRKELSNIRVAFAKPQIQVHPSPSIIFQGQKGGRILASLIGIFGNKLEFGRISQCRVLKMNYVPVYQQGSVQRLAFAKIKRVRTAEHHIFLQIHPSRVYYDSTLLSYGQKTRGPHKNSLACNYCAVLELKIDKEIARDPKRLNIDDQQFSGWLCYFYT